MSDEVMPVRPQAPLITLLTDFGGKDAYVGVMKAVMLSICPGAQIVDLCHEVAPQEVEEAAYLLGSAWRYCPEGTVHVVVVDPGVGGGRRVLAVAAGGHLFVAPDNGVLTQVLADAEDYQAFWVERREHFRAEVSATFEGRDVMAPVAARLARGMPIEQVGRPAAGPLVLLPVSRAVRTEVGLETHVVHVDRFGNLVTDLTEAELLAWKRERAAEQVVIRVGGERIREVRRTYAGAERGQLLALVGSTGRLEIAVNMGSAADRLGVGRGAIIIVEGQP